MKEIIIDTLLDTLKLLPFLLFAFILIELIEHKLTNKSKKIITKNQKYGPIIGALLGVIPQCGFSVMATNLYITKIIPLGTLISIYLSTSDEMLPILISEKTDIKIILKILITKVTFGIIYGIIINLILNKKDKNKIKEDYQICEEQHCNCKKSILSSSIKHTLSTIIYILIITFILNTIFHYIGNSILTNFFIKVKFLSPFITSLIGLIPNCAASVIITELYIKKTINFAALIAGLLSNSGTSLLILLKSNKSLKDNIKIILLLYILGIVSGTIINIIEIYF